MRNGKHVLRALGLSFLAALGLMAFMAVGAQASVWDVNGTLVSEALLPQVDGKLKGEGLLLTVTGEGKNHIIIHCKALSVTAGNLHLKDATATLQYDNSTCLTLLNGVNQPNCSHTEGIIILPVKALILTILHTDKKVYLLAEPQPGQTNFTQIHYGPKCALPLVSIKGNVAFECEDGNLVERSCEVAAVKQLIRPALSQSLFGDELIYGANKATLEGEAEVFLKGGNHAGLPFNAL
jgi:hypothetical protein